MKREPAVQRLLRVSRTVSDLEKAASFYIHALGFLPASEMLLTDPAWGELMGMPGMQGRSVMLRLGEQQLELIEFDPCGSLYPLDSQATDLWFQHIAIVVGDMAAAYAHLCRYPFIAITGSGPQHLPSNTGSVIAFKFRDPDGHPVELLYFPAGTGKERWQHKADLFRGIDHTAISVSTMRQSMDFYTHLLDLHVASRSVNSGPEQERLDRAPDVLVSVAGLQPNLEDTPHLELLGYERPPGRPIPKDVKSSDVAIDKVVLAVSNLPGLIVTLEAANIAFVSLGMVTFRNGQCAVQVCDPTGHRLILTEESILNDAYAR